MKLYPTHSNESAQRNGIFRVTINDLHIIRWSDEPLRYIHSSRNSLDHLRIPKGTTTPDFWKLK